MINQISDNTLMESFYNMVPYFKYYFGENVGFTISNTKKFLFVQNTDTLKINFKAGDAIPEGSAADVCLHKKEVIDIIVPEKVFGFPVRTVGVPIFEDGEIAGTMVISMSIDKIEKVNKISNLSNSIAESLNGMSTNVKGMTDVFVQINETNESIEDYIKITRDNYKKTDDILKFINSVTRRTNLLGLNASIESARAGKAGEGFSVVATEIRKLSESTKQSLTEINDVLNSIKNSIDEIYDRFQCSNDLLENQINGLQNIKTGIENLQENAKELNIFAEEI